MPLWLVWCGKALLAVLGLVWHGPSNPNKAESVIREEGKKLQSPVTDIKDDIKNV